jgi:hypothetical protein
VAPDFQIVQHFAGVSTPPNWHTSGLGVTLSQRQSTIDERPDRVVNPTKERIDLVSQVQWLVSSLGKVHNLDE